MGIERVVRPPQPAAEITHQRRHQARHQCCQVEPAQRQHLDREDRTGQRRAEHRAKAGRHPAHQQQAPGLAGQAQAIDQAMRQAAAQLHCGAFTPCRSAEQMRGHCADQHERRHGQRHPAAGLVNFIKDQIVAALCPRAKAAIEPGHRKATQRQAIKQPGRGKAQPRDRIE